MPSPATKRTSTLGPHLRVDLAIIGGGSAAFAAAAAASERGVAVALIERGEIGGTCVNVGCVPSKALVRAAEALHRSQATPFAGISVSGRITDFAALARQQQAQVARLRMTKYRDVLARMPGVQLVHGHARFLADRVLAIGGRTIAAERFIIATGARPRLPPIPGVAEVGVLTSTDALALDALPASLAVIGGRFVALELAQAFARLGVRVTIVQRGERILPDGDPDVSEEMTRHLRDEGIDVVTGATIAGIRRDGDVRELDVRVGGIARDIRAHQVLVATGRSPNTHDLGLAAAGVETDLDGHVVVDDHLRTTAPHVYAAGDVKGAPAFVYAAAYEGRLAAENALGGSAAPRDYRALPWVIFTDPQIAAVGLDERSAAAAGVAVDVAKVPLGVVPRALVARDERGFIKLIKRRDGDELLGAVIVAPEAGDLIMEPSLAIRHGIGVSQLAAAFHPYLTQAEGVRLAAQAFTRDVTTLSCCSA